MMKQLVYLLFFVMFGISSQAQKINWMSFDQAVAAQKKSPKPIFIDVYTNWCGPCKLLDEATFSDAEVIKYINDNFYAVKFNAEGNEDITFLDKSFKNPRYDPNRANSRNSMHEFTTHLKIQAYPSMVVIGKEAKIEKVILGFRNAKQLLTEIK